METASKRGKRHRRCKSLIKTRDRERSRPGRQTRSREGLRQGPKYARQTHGEIRRGDVVRRHPQRIKVKGKQRYTERNERESKKAEGKREGHTSDSGDGSERRLETE